VNIFRRFNICSGGAWSTCRFYDLDLANQSYNNQHYKGSNSFSLVQPFPLDVKVGEKLDVWREVFGEKYWHWQVCLHMFASGVQTPKWLSSSPKWDIVDIMANVLSLMETCLIKMYLISTLITVELM